jgi:hypothetical protein
MGNWRYVATMRGFSSDVPVSCHAPLCGYHWHCTASLKNATMSLIFNILTVSIYRVRLLIITTMGIVVVVVVVVFCCCY